MIFFFATVGLVALLHSDGLWAKLLFGIILAVTVLLISWCAWTTSEAKADFGLSRRIYGDAGTPKEVFNRLWRPRRQRVSTSPKLVNPAESSRYSPPDVTTPEMGGIDRGELASAV